MHAARPAAVLQVAVGGGTLCAEVWGEGPPLLLLHGWALDHRVWRPQLEGLSDRFRLIALDRRGFGRSNAPPDLERELEDLLTLCGELDLDRLALVGMSQGGRVALHFAHRNPELLIGLVLQGSPLDGFQPEPRGKDAIPIADYTALAREGRLDEMKAQWRAHPLMHVGSESAQHQLDAMLRDYAGRDLMATSPHGLRPIAASLHEIDVPALVITGEHDTPWRTLAGDALAYGLPNARRAVLAGGYHLCNLTHPQEYNSIVAGFVDGLHAQAAGLRHPRRASPQ